MLTPYQNIRRALRALAACNSNAANASQMIAEFDFSAYATDLGQIDHALGELDDAEIEVFVDGDEHDVAAITSWGEGERLANLLFEDFFNNADWSLR